MVERAPYFSYFRISKNHKVSPQILNHPGSQVGPSLDHPGSTPAEGSLRNVSSLQRPPGQRKWDHSRNGRRVEYRFHHKNGDPQRQRDELFCHSF